MDFSKITQISIPEGNVVEIANDQGVLWRKNNLSE